MNAAEIVIPRPAGQGFSWWDSKPPTQASMERHLGKHLTENIRLHWGLPLYDLELCAASGIQLPGTEAILDTWLNGSKYMNYGKVSFAAHTMVVGAYLGVFSAQSISVLPGNFAAEPYAQTRDISFVEAVYDIAARRNPRIEKARVPYAGGSLAVSTLLDPEFTPFKIFVAAEPIAEVVSKTPMLAS